MSNPRTMLDRRTLLRQSTGALALIGAAGAASLARAEVLYPNRPVRLVVPYPPGGGSDFLARAVGKKLSELWGQSVIVDNRPGASGVLGARHVAQSAPDGYTLLQDIPSYVVNPVLMSNLPYDARRDFVPVTTIMRYPSALAVAASSPWHTLQQLIVDAKAAPGKLTIGNSQSLSHLTAELFKQAAGIDILNVPYKGAAPMMNDLIGGHVSMGLIPITTALPQMKSGTMRVLGLTSKERVASLPDLPTLTEQGVPVETYAWTGVFAPAGTPPELVQKIQSDIASVLAMPDLRDQIGQNVAVMGGEPPEQFRQFIDRELDRWVAVARAANIKPE